MSSERRNKDPWVVGLADSSIAGAGPILAGSVAFMWIVTAEVLYPGYSTRQEISDPGSTAPPDPVVHQPSATIFNGTMLVTGALALVAAYFVYRSLGSRTFAGSLAVFEAGVFPDKSSRGAASPRS